MSALRWKCVKCALRISLDCEPPFFFCLPKPWSRTTKPSLKASWMTSIESLIGNTSQLMMTWFAHVYEQWACRSIVSCLRQVRIFLYICVMGLLMSGQGREAGYEWIFYDVGGSRTHVGRYYVVTI